MLIMCSTAFVLYGVQAGRLGATVGRGKRRSMCVRRKGEDETVGGGCGDGSTAVQGGWRAFDAKTGTPIDSMRELLRSKSVERADALLIGETHDDPVAHRLEEELLREAIELPGRKPVLSMESLETDVQLVLDEYLSGTIRESDFKNGARLPFNYDTDYKPLVEIAKENGVSVLAANAPRRYVSLARRVGREGLQAAISTEAQRFLPPLPYAGPSTKYREKFARTMAALMDGGKPLAPDMPVPDPPAGMLDSQSLWDASMAYSICSAVAKEKENNLKEQPLIVHIGGVFHVEQRLGIMEHIPNYDGNVQVATVIIKPGNLEKMPDPKGLKEAADFLVITDETVPRSY